MVGNDFVGVRPRLQLAALAADDTLTPLAITPVVTSHQEVVTVAVSSSTQPIHRQIGGLAYRHSLIVFALLFLLVSASGIEVGVGYWSARLTKPASFSLAKPPSITGLSLTVPAAQLQSRIQSITHQTASLTVGSQTVPV